MAASECSAKEIFLSDVHVNTPFLRTSITDVAITRFRIMRPAISSDPNLMQEIRPTFADEDGDLSPLRKDVKHEDCDYITIEHHLSTAMEDIGLQVWRGTLLLCDYIVHHEDRFDGCTMLELGAGLGLCSIIVGRVAKRVFCTDIGDIVLQKCKDNIAKNSHLFKYGNDAVVVREFDWLKNGILAGESDFCWTKEDQDALKDTSVLLAADVIYDDLLTDAFVESILTLFNKAKAEIVLYLTIEKRLNFTLRDLAVTSPAYDYFLCRIEKLETVEQKLKARQLRTDFPKYLQYERVKELVISLLLWRI
ncbi:methyltransferase-like protein 22 isoform X2 [Montipora capricornis]|uniref:methyltransferase-like protein 22 isoform X2 n=2 Tax=Montipora capricornis TaxID=246305 RepID=UPI0035F1D954